MHRIGQVAIELLPYVKGGGVIVTAVDLLCIELGHSDAVRLAIVAHLRNIANRKIDFSSHISFVLVV